MPTEAELLGERIAEMAAHLDAATHGLLAALRDYDRSNNWYAQGFASCAKWLSWRVGMGAGTAREHLRVAQRLGDLPLIDDALRTGSISYSKVRAMTRVATPVNEAVLLEDARHSTGSQLETICRKYATVVRASKEVDEDYDRQRRSVSRRDLHDGFVRIEATLHPEEAALLWAALDRIARERALCVQVGSEVDAMGSPVRAQDTTALPSSSHASDVVIESAATPPAPRGEFNRADALVAMAQSVARGTTQRRSPVELVVTVAADVLGGVPAGTSVVPHVRPTTSPAERLPGLCAPFTNGTPASAVSTPLLSPTTEPSAPFAVFADGTCVSAETARRLACDCGVVHIVEDDHGNALSVGRKTRSIPTPLKRALEKRDPCCRFPGCTNRLYVEGHHILHWANGGETSLGNLVSLCEFHHRFVHEYEYRVELDEAQRPAFFDRRGNEVRDVPDRPSMDRCGYEVVAERNAELEIDSETNECLWDGSRVNYGDVIDALVRVDHLS